MSARFLSAVLISLYTKSRSFQQRDNVVTDYFGSAIISGNSSWWSIGNDRSRYLTASNEELLRCAAQYIDEREKTATATFRDGEWLKRQRLNYIRPIQVTTVTIAATLRWFTAGGAIRIALRQLLQNRKLRHWWRHNLGSRWKLQKNGRREF